MSGVTDAGSALEAVELGCDAVAFDFRPDSPNRLVPERAREIGERLPLFTGRVGHFGAEPVIRVLEVVRQVGITAVWFDGSPPMSTDALSPIPWIGTVPYTPEFDPSVLRELGCLTFVLRADGWDSVRTEWARAKSASIYGRIILSPVSPEEAGWAVACARPYGVCLGPEYEFEPCRLDLERVEELVRAVRQTEPWLRKRTGS